MNSPGEDERPKNSSSTSGVDLDVDLTDVDYVRSVIDELPLKRAIEFRPTRLNRVRVTFVSRRWDWFRSGQAAEELGWRLRDAGLPVSGGFTSRSDYWSVQAGLDDTVARSQSASPKSEPLAADIADLRSNYLFIIETACAFTNFTPEDREHFRHGLNHHRAHTVGQSNLGRTQVTVFLSSADSIDTAAGIGAKATTGIRDEWPIVGIRVCRSTDWFTELAINPDGRLEPEIRQAYDYLT